MDDATQSGADTSELSQDQAISAISEAMFGNEEPDQDGLEQAADQNQDENQDDEGQAESDTPEDQGEKTYTLKVNGKDVVKTESEVIADAQKVNAAQEKFEEASRIRHQFEQQQNVVAQERAQLQEVVTAYRTQLQQMMQQAEPNWSDLMENDPQGYLRTKHDWDAYQQKLFNAQQIENGLKAQQQQEFNQRKLAHDREQAQLLVQLIPEMGDPAKRTQELNEMSTYLQGMQLDPNRVLSDIDDHRFMKILRDAAKYQTLVSKQTVTSNRVEKLPPKVERSGRSPAQEAPKNLDMDRLRKSGRAQDAAALIAKLL